MNNPIEKYGIEILRLLDNKAVQIIFATCEDKHRLSNNTIALSILFESDDLKRKVLMNINRIKRESIKDEIEQYLNTCSRKDIMEEYPELKADTAEADNLRKQSKKNFRNAINEAQKTILDLIVKHESEGRIVISSGGDIPSVSGIEMTSFKRMVEVDSMPESPPVDTHETWHKAIHSLPDFNILKIDPKEMIKYWVEVSSWTRRESLFILDAVVDKLIDPFSKHLFEIALNDYSDGELIKESDRKHRSIIEMYERRLEIMRRGIVGICEGDSPRLLLYKFNSLFSHNPLDPELAIKEAEHMTSPSISEEDNEYSLMVKFIFFAIKSFKEGILSLECYRDKMEPYCKEGFGLAIDGLEPNEVNAIVTNKKKAILRELEIKMDMFANLCLALRKTTNPRMLFSLLKSYFPDSYFPEDFDLW